MSGTVQQAFFNLTNMSIPPLFTPLTVGDVTLEHRVVLAPLTRLRAQQNQCHSQLAVKYYEQRASTPGTLLIAEGTLIAAQAGGYNNVPGIWNKEQIDSWKPVCLVFFHSISSTDSCYVRSSTLFTPRNHLSISNYTQRDGPQIRKCLKKGDTRTSLHRMCSSPESRFLPVH